MSSIRFIVDIEVEERDADDFIESGFIEVADRAFDDMGLINSGLVVQKFIDQLNEQGFTLNIVSGAEVWD